MDLQNNQILFFPGIILRCEADTVKHVLYCLQISLKSEHPYYTKR